MTLVFSRHQYVYVTHSQKLGDLITGLDEAWRSFGGVTARVVIDNLKAAVVKASRYEPAFQRTFNEYAACRGFVVDAALPKHPTGKPHVERQVPYVRDNFFRGENWLGRDHVQREAVCWCTETAGTRIHGTTRKQPLLEFETSEKAALKPISEATFDTPLWGEPRVHPDQHVRFALALYSVPHQHNREPTKGKQVTVRGDSRLVRIYLRGELIKTHPRMPPGGRSTDHSDYPAEKTPYTMRDADFIVSTAKERGAAVGELAERLLSGDFPWAKLRQAQKLLRLADKYGAERVDTACRRALGFDLINVQRVEKIVVQALVPKPSVGENDGDAEVIQLPLKFLRPSMSLNHAQKKEDNDHGSPTIP